MCSMHSEISKSNGQTPAGGSSDMGPADAPREHNELVLSARSGRKLGPGSRLTGWSNRDLNKALSYLGWTGAELARRIGYSKSQVSRIRQGEAPVPSVVEAYLMVVIKIADMVDGN